MSLSEFELIQKYFTSRATQRNDIVLGVGDDGAIVNVPHDKELVISMDTLISGVHFSMETSPYAIGHKALAVNLSDIAAMGAEPAWFTLALSLPEADETWLEEFSAGVFALADRFNVCLIGGDTTRGPLSVTIQIAGLVPPGSALRRQGAQPKDLIYVTGFLGDAALGLLAIQKKISLPKENYSIVTKRLNQPEPRVKQGLLLRDVASACIDISDGLVADLNHLLEASEMGAKVFVDKLPLSEALRQSNREPSEQIQLALTGGDDYELCFCIAPQQQSAFNEAMETNDCPMTCIGEIQEDRKLNCIYSDGSSFEIQGHGYVHF